MIIRGMNKGDNNEIQKIEEKKKTIMPINKN